MAIESAMLMPRRSNKKTEELEREVEEMMKEAEEAARRGPQQVAEVEEEEPARDDPPKREEPPQSRSEPPEDNPEPLSNEEKTYKKRYGDLRRHSQKQMDDLRKEIDQLKNELKSSTAATSMPPSDPEKIKQWAETNPQAAAIIRAIAGEQAETKSKEFSTRLEEIEEISRNVAREKEEAKVFKAHPDFDEIREDDAFHDWVDTQPEAIQNMVYDNGQAKELIFVLNMYKRDNNIKTKEEEKDAARSTSPKSGKPAVGDQKTKKFSESMVQRMTADEYAKNEDAITEAIQNGDFVYDITGAAR